MTKTTRSKQKPNKRFRITFRSEVYIEAASEAEARLKFERITPLFSELASNEYLADFVEETSFEEERL